MKRPIENNSSPGQAVYNPFVGSGTTIIAGEITGRCVHAIELNPAYVDVAVTRWQNFTGQQAKLQATGMSFAETATDRQAPTCRTRERDQGDARPKALGRDRRSGRIETIFGVLEAARDITIEELRRTLAQRGLVFGEGTLRRFFKRHAITRKKRPHTPPSRIVPTS